MVWSLAPFWTWPGRTPGLSTIGLFRPKGVKGPKNHAQAKKTKKNEKNEKPSPDTKMHRTVPKTLLHSSLATGTSNGDPVVQQKKKVQKRPFLTLKTVPFGPPIPAPGSPRTHKTKKFSSRVMIPDNYASKGVHLRRNEKKWFDR